VRRWQVLFVVLALAAVAVPARAAAAPGVATTLPSRGRVAAWPSGAVPGRLLVTTRGPARVATLLGALGASPRSSIGARAVALSGSVARLDVPPGSEAAVAARLRARPDVVAVEPVATLNRRAVPDDPEYVRQWAHPRTGADLAWETTTGSADVLVAVVDDGIDATHPELAGAVAAQVDTSDGIPRPVAAAPTTPATSVP